MYSVSQYSPETEKLRRTNRFITRFESKIIRSDSGFKKFRLRLMNVVWQRREEADDLSVQVIQG